MAVARLLRYGGRAAPAAAGAAPEGGAGRRARRRFGGVAAAATGAAAFEGELAVALGACGCDMEAALGGPIVPPDLVVDLPV